MRPTLNTASAKATEWESAARDWSVEVVPAGTQTTTAGSNGRGIRTA